MNAEAKIAELELQLPPAPKPGGVYQPVLIIGNFAYVSGHGPVLEDESYITGRVGSDLDVAEGKSAARQTGLAILASLRAHLGSLDRIKQLVKSFGMVNAMPDFAEHPQVINGYSELMAEVFGPKNGVGTRSAVGMGSLPNNIAVEIEAVFEVISD
jgi:enamine deaminase RidA (YjgF/YER057c/UK114 family)|tara:strand:+ start:100 stop:567 length:468 start_codon:yes stop_codon:yes gene_type:complete